MKKFVNDIRDAIRNHRGDLPNLVLLTREDYRHVHGHLGMSHIRGVKVGWNPEISKSKLIWKRNSPGGFRREIIKPQAKKGPCTVGTHKIFTVVSRVNESQNVQHYVVALTFKQATDGFNKKFKDGEAYGFHHHENEHCITGKCEGDFTDNLFDVMYKPNEDKEPLTQCVAATDIVAALRKFNRAVPYADIKHCTRRAREVLVVS